MGNDQMMLGIDRCLNVIADNAGAPAACRHRARVWIGERDLLVWCRTHLDVKLLKTLHLLLQLDNLLLQAGRLGRARRRRFLPIGTVHLMQIARDALLDLLQPPLHLGVGEVLVAIVDRLELAAIDRNARLVNKPIVRHSAMNREHTWRMARPLSLRKSAIVL